MEPVLQYSDNITYNKTFSDAEEKKNLFEQDIADAYLNKIPEMLSKYEEKINDYEKISASWINTVLKERLKDSKGKRFGRLVLKVSIVFLSVITVVPLAFWLVFEVFGIRLSRRLTYICSSKEFNAKSELKDIHKRFSKDKMFRFERPEQPLDFRVVVHYNTDGHENNLDKQLTVSVVEAYYKKSHKTDPTAESLEEKRQKLVRLFSLLRNNLTLVCN